MTIQNLLLFLPLILMVLINLLNGTSFSSDNTQYFFWTMYHVKSLAQGIFPLWNPFHAWGSEDGLDMRFLGDFNPIYLLIPVLTLFGCPAQDAYTVAIAVYFLIGCLGFYYLANRIYKDNFIAALAYVLLMFSSFKYAVLQQFCIPVIFVTSIWFFVYCLDLMHSKNLKEEIRAVLGLTFVLMMIVTSYIPFYFLTVVICVGLALIIFFPSGIGQFFRRIWTAALRVPSLFWFCFMALALACIPSYLWYKLAQDPFYVLQVDRGDPHFSNAAAVTMDMINSGVSAAMISWQELFSDFKWYANHWAYLSVFVYLIFFLSFLNKSNRIQRVILFSGFLVFLISLAGLTPVLGFLYEHVFIFKLFRNYFFFIQFIMAFVILFLVGELKTFLAKKAEIASRNPGLILYISIVHILFFLFLLQFQAVPLSSHVTVIISLVWFVLWLSNVVPISRNVFLWGILCVTIIGPLDVMGNWDSYQKGRYEYPHNEVAFKYQRPLPGNGFNEHHGFHYRTKIFRDESGFVEKGYLGTKYSYELHSNVDKDQLKKYVQNKFLLYDHVSIQGPDLPNWDELAQNLSSFNNDAFVYDPQALKLNPVVVVSGAAIPVTEGSEGFKVVKFDLNNLYLQTNFSKRKFLVYNDSFHKDWRVFMDGHEQALFRANWAFKGVWVEQGQHHVQFSFKYPHVQVLYFFMAFFMLAWFLVLLLVFMV